MTRRLQAAIMSAFLVLAGCGQGGQPDSADETAAATRGPETGSGEERIAITAPEDGSTIDGGAVEVVTTVTGFELVDKLGEEAQEGEGHIIYYLGNGYEVPTEPLRPADAGGQGAFTSAASAKTTYSWPEHQVLPGEAKFVVQLVNNDNTPLDPPVVAEVSVNVKA